MGYTSYAASSYNSREVLKKATGVADFAYTRTMDSKPVAERVAHASMDPKRLAAGKLIEARDSAAHPLSLPVAVFLDHTGSMGSVINAIRQSMPTLMNLLVTHNNVPDPQIFFGSIGDIRNGDPASLQVGEFESGNELDVMIENIFLAGGGGGNDGESYDLGWYVADNFFVCDHIEKGRGKGYLFFIGDEPFFEDIHPDDVFETMGIRIQPGLRTEDVAKRVNENWNTFFVFPRGASNFNRRDVPERWARLVGQNVLKLEDPSKAAELVASTVGLFEGRSLADIKSSLTATGVDARGTDAVATALSVLGDKVGAGKGLTVGSVSGGTLSSGEPGRRRARRVA